MSEFVRGIRATSCAMIIGAAAVGLHARAEIAEDINHMVETAFEGVSYDGHQSYAAGSGEPDFNLANNDIATNLFLALGSGAVITGGLSLLAAGSQRRVIFTRMY